MNLTKKSELNNPQVRSPMATLAGKLIRTIFILSPVFGGKNPENL